MNNSLVTIGVASYNNAKYIIETLESINNQTYDNIELIIVDDFSDDESVMIIEDWLPLCRFPHKFIKNECNKGIPKVCNLILKFCNEHSEFLCVIGSDDIMEKIKVETQVNFLQKNTEYAMCFSDMLIIDENSKKVNDSYFSFINETIFSIKSFLTLAYKEQLEYIIRKNILPAPSFMFRSKIISDINGWDEELYFEDWDMNLKLINKGYKIGFVNERLVKYRILNSSVVRNPSPFFYSSILKLIFKYRGLGKKIDKAINEKLEQYSYLIYMSNGNDAGRWLLETWKVDKKFKSFLLTVFAYLGIKYSFIKKLKVN